MTETDSASETFFSEKENSRYWAESEMNYVYPVYIIRDSKNKGEVIVVTDLGGL
jgi:hypothetical protein